MLSRSVMTALLVCDDTGPPKQSLDGAPSRVSTGRLGHPPMGRSLRDRRTTNSVTLNTDFTYNADGSVATEVYPSGRTITYTAGAAGHALEARDVANSINYVTAASYAPQGALYKFANGSSISGAMTYNSRLQPLQLYFVTGTISPTTLTQLQQNACPTATATIMSRSYNFGLGTNDN